MNSDTIVAVATPAGVGGIAVIRLSGPDALALATPHLSPFTSHLSPFTFHLPPRRATYCRFDDIDDGIAVYYPTGYTGEPTVEFSCHGSTYVQQAIVQALLDSGARMAEPGEFTLRAFLHGRLNLSQAEAVADLIDAVTPQQHQLAVSQLRGGYAEQLRVLRQQLLDLTALLELELDFSQEDVEFADRQELCDLIKTINLQLTALIDSFATGNALKCGIPVAIVGRPNAGKSSLLNALLSDDRAIVSPIPGTTRDTIEEALTIDGLTFRFIDPAGLREERDLLEDMGFHRSIQAAQRAQVILYVRDIRLPFDKEALDDIAHLTSQCDMKGKLLLVVHNKCDLPHEETPLGNIISALDGTGIDDLRHNIAQAMQEQVQQTGGVLLANVRHRDALLHVREALLAARQDIVGGQPADLVAVHLRDALYHLGTITGEVASDEVLSNIFSRFCIGK